MTEVATWRSTRAYLFIAFLPERHVLHRALQHAGFVLVFKPVIRMRRGGIKCNVDVDLVFRVMAELSAYERAVIVTGDGDFSLLVRYLLVNGRLEVVISPDTGSCSALLRHSAGGRITFMAGLRQQLEYRPHPKEASWTRSSR